MCNLMEGDRYLCDEQLIACALNLDKKEFVTKTEQCSTRRKGKQEYLKDKENEFNVGVNTVFRNQNQGDKN